MRTIKIIKRSVAFVTVALSFITCLGQKQSVEIEKKHCTYPAFLGEKLVGAKLVIHFASDTLQLSSANEYGLKDFINLPDSIKLFIVEKLLEYESDTSLCCMDVIGRVFNDLDIAKGVPKTKRYNIQVDALYMINRICWPKSIDWYSSYTVLYDNKLKKEINDDPKKIEYLFREYRKWFATCKADGKIYKYFPFNDGRYVWFGGHKSVAPKDY
jgi:hypothetical protein